MKHHEYFMKRALSLAERGKGRVNPNPLVGAVIVKDGRIIAEGWHERYGGSHAEVNAIHNQLEPVAGGTLYVTLEPCSHYGQTPPCAQLIIRSGIQRVIIGAADPNPLVSGRGIQLLEAAGIQVETGILEAACRQLNEVFFKYIRTRRPFVLIKAAISLDGKIATATGESQWISSAESRAEVQHLRNQFTAIMVGGQTVLMDNPRLTCRLEGGRNPIRIVADSHLRTPLQANVLKHLETAPTIFAVTKEAPEKKIEQVRALGAKVLVLPKKDGRVDLDALMAALGREGIDGILVEGGGTLSFGLLKEKAVDKVRFYLAPIILGGEGARSPVSGAGFANLDAGRQVKQLSVRKVGPDLCLEGYLKTVDEKE